jgi:hypothetical protein
MTAIAVECADRAALNAKHAARIPPVCEVLPRAIESRAKTLRFVVAAGFTDSPFKPASVGTWDRQFYRTAGKFLCRLASRLQGYRASR